MATELLINGNVVYAASRDLAYVWNTIFRKALAILAHPELPSPVDAVSDREQTRKDAMSVVEAAAKAIQMASTDEARDLPVTQLLLKCNLFQFDPTAVAAALTALGQAFVGMCVAASKSAALDQSISAFSDLSGINSPAGTNGKESS